MCEGVSCFLIRIGKEGKRGRFNHFEERGVLREKDGCVIDDCQRS